MKNLLKLALPAVLAFGIVSCEEDPFDDDGDTRDIFEGSWTVAEDSKLIGQRNYSSDIEKDANFPSRINMFNFYKLGVNDSIYGTVSSVLAEAVTIPSQTLNGNHVNGSGTLVNDNLINFTFYVDDGNDIDTVEAVFTR